MGMSGLSFSGLESPAALECVFWGAGECWFSVFVNLFVRATIFCSCFHSQLILVFFK